MDPDAPSISVIVITRDRPELLADALRGVVGQVLAPREVRIGNEGATPVSAAALARAGIATIVIDTRAGQAAAARNRAAHGASGEVLAFLDDDDRWRPAHLEGLAAAFADAATGIAYRDCAVVRERIGPRGERVTLESRTIARDWDAALMRTDDYLPPSAWGVRRSLFERLGGFDTAFRFSEDWDFLLRAARETVPRRVPGTTVEVRLRAAGNASADLGPERLACLERLARRHGLPRLVPKTFWEVAALVAAPRSGP
jgi:glycosyltransferase involved in cell wall biosynthesis